MKNYFIFSMTIILLVFSNSCKKEETDEINVIRPLVAFTTADIPTFKGMTQTKNIENSFFGATKILNESYYAEYEFRWTSEEGDFAYFDIWILANHDEAVTALTEMHEYYTNPFINESIDEPAAVGNISYMDGREFIRDNLIITIHTSEKFDNSITEIAKYIDSKILKSQSFFSISEVKPSIEDFKINSNPVVEQSKTPLTIQVKDPNNKNIVYQWRFDKDSGYGGIEKDNSEIYKFVSPWFDSANNNIGLTLIAINDYGFCADSTIYIQIIKE